MHIFAAVRTKKTLSAMKKAFYLAFAAVAMCACNGKGSYTVSGQFQEFESRMIWLISDGQPVDSAASTDGNFSFKGNCTTPQLAYIADSRDRRQAGKLCRFILEPGKMQMKKLDMEGQDQYTVTGTLSNDLMAGFTEKSAAFEAEYMNSMDKPEVLESLEGKFTEMQSDAMNGNMDNMFGLYMLSQMQYEMLPSEVMAALKNFEDGVKASGLYGTLYSTAEKQLKREVGQPYMDFSLPTPDGAMLSAKDVISNPDNRYVLIDFWASWCGPCMGEVPHLKETYAQYKSKGFEILGVSLDRAREPWLNAIGRNEMDWLHISDLKYWNCEAAGIYAVNSIPSNFLIDCKSGLIIATQLRGEALKRKIAELLD